MTLLTFFAGTVFVFRVYGIVVAVFFILFVLVNFYNRNEGGITKDLPDDVDPKTVSYSVLQFKLYSLVPI